MNRRHSISQAARHTRRTVFIVAGVYVGVGFFVAVPAALRGDPLSTFVGFLIVSGALGGAVALNVLLRVGVQISEVGDAIEDVRDSVHSLEEGAIQIASSDATGAPSTALLDLAALGSGDPAGLAAATLDRSVFPRLVHAMEDTSVTLAHDADAGEDEAPPVQHSGMEGEGGSSSAQPSSREESPAGLTTRNLLRTWKVALREGDLLTCRSVFSALVDIVDRDRLAPLRELLDDLTHRTERSLREAFSLCLAEKDYEGAVRVGERICTLLADHRIAGDFRRIKPQLERLADTQKGSRARDVAAVR